MVKFCCPDTFAYEWLSHEQGYKTKFQEYSVNSLQSNQIQSNPIQSKCNMAGQANLQHTVMIFNIASFLSLLVPLTCKIISPGSILPSAATAPL